MTDALQKLEPLGVLVPDQQSAVYPGNDAWLQIEQAATSPSGDPAWLQIQLSMASGGPGADPAWVELER